MGLFTLNEVGTFVWERLDGRPLGRIADELVQAFEVEHDQVRADLLDFIGQLEKAGCTGEGAR
jgi:hypothetical protein